ncbi:ATPase, T2SS/T4P/T4SS family [bacterium]|nr:ATPase, T2SS/T4P/T4SS family [bacterium]
MKGGIVIFGRKKNVEEEPDEEEQEEEFLLFQGALNGEEADLKKNAKLARAGLVHAKEILSDALSRRAHAVILEPKGAKTAIRLMVDGMPYSGGAIPAKRGSAVTQIIKLLAGMDIGDRRNPQKGGIKAEYRETPYELYVESLPVAAGVERLTIRSQNMKKLLLKPADVGMPEEMKQRIRAMGTQKSGMILVCGPPDSGTTTTATVAVHAFDSYLYTLFALGDFDQSKLTNITLFDPVPEHTLSETIVRIMRKEGELLYVDPLTDGDTARILYEHHDRITFVFEVPGAATPAAAMQKMIEWLGPEAAAACIKAVMTQKLIRKLCEPCREAYRPNPKLLKKLGLPPETKVLYREPAPPDEEDPDALSIEEMCGDCDGMPYHDRVAMFELVEVTEGMQQVILQGADETDVKRQAAEDGMTTLQKDGLRLVADGTTSLEEMQRVFSSGKKRPGKKKKKRRPRPE